MDLFTITIGISILIYIVIGSYAGRSIDQDAYADYDGEKVHGYPASQL